MPEGQPVNGRSHRPSMPLSGRPEEITHWVGVGGGCLRSERKWRESPGLIRQPGSSSPLGVLWEKSGVVGPGGGGPGKARGVGTRAGGGGGGDPRVKPGGGGGGL